ncbi:hypothetical protein E4T39_02812 [Aureobasidium subglaciale]|nr:hypothetical protein E4T39_02812 [Aureobasidium subglaciale]
MQNPNIPTAPKAIRGPPMAPRASVDRGQPPHRPLDRNVPAPARAPPGAPRAPAWNQWIRPGAPQYRDPAVPAKRDANGDEKSQQFMPRMSPQSMHRQTSDPSSMRAEEVKDDRAFRTAPASPERKTLTSNMATRDEHPPFEKEFSVPSPDDEPQYDPMVDAEIATAESSDEDISDEEGMDLDEEDFAQSKAKFERQKAHLEAQMIDLNAREYRATTPLELIARLAKITAQDLPVAQAPGAPEAKEDIMDGVENSQISAPVIRPAHSIPVQQIASTTHQDVEPDLITPKQEQIDEAETATIPPVQAAYQQLEPNRVVESAEIDQDEDIDMNGSDDLDYITPEPKRSIESITLPYLAKAPLTPLSDLGAFHENIARLNAAKPALIAHYQSQAEEEKSLQKSLQEQYLEKYRAWKLETQLLDRERASKESVERQMSVELGLDIESSPILENPISESRSRLHKFSSEYDIQQVLKQSEETARLEQEKVERESRRAQIDLEKEAIPPEMWDEASKEKHVFKNMNRFREPICLTEIYGYEPEFDTFTETEHKRFVELFKERPKQWGEIAAQLPGRSYADCIHHYYKYKWDGRFKEKAKRKGKAGGRRGGKTGTRARAAPLMADLSKGEEDSSSGPMLTETGRPRRAATRTAYTAEKDPEIKTAAAASATTTKKVLAAGEISSEKPAKRRKTTAAGEKPQKRGRQTLISTANSVTSPAGIEKEVVPSKEDLIRAKQLEDAALLAGIGGHRIMPGVQPIEYAPEPFPPQVASDNTERTRVPAQTSSMQRSSASSYWSVPEQTDFVKFIAHFGTDFGAIANHMGTKTQTMVKNYYQRLVESGNRNDVVDAANVANARRDRGEDMGIPPTPTPINKRRYDNPGPALPRTASGSQGEVMDIDPVPSSQPSTISQPSSQFQHQYRFSMATQPTSAPPQRAAPTPLQPHGSPGMGKAGIRTQSRASTSSSGPKMGFFSEARMERRPTLQSSERPAQQPSPSLMHQQQPTPPGLMHQNLSHLTSEFVKNLKEEQERALSIQKRASQEHVPQVVQHSLYQPLAAQTSAPTGSPQLSMLDRPMEREERSGTPGMPPLAHPRAGPAMFRNILDSPGPIQSPAVTMHPPFRSAHVPSPPKQEQPLYRPGSVPAPSPAASVVKPAMSLTAGPSAEPRKTSNLASLLNSEPEEPRQKKRVSEQGATPFTQSPTPSTLSVAPSGPSSTIFPPRREVFNQTLVSRQEFEGRSMYNQPTSHAPTPAAQHELMTGRSGTPLGSRQPEWQSRPPMGQNLASSSPHPPAPLERDVRPYFSHRANLGSLNPQSRTNPSPPPNAHPYMNHSRTPSIGGRPLTPSQLQSQGPAGMSHMAQAQTSQAQPQLTQGNPYSQGHGGPSHMQQQMQTHQQNQYGHRHNSSGGSSHGGLHQRQPSRGEEMSMLRQQQQQQQQQQQERDFHMSREREHRMEVDRQYKEREAHFHQQQEQQRYAQHRTPQPFPQQSLPGAPPPALSLREQARIEAEQSYRDARHRDQYEQEMHVRRIQEDEERMRYEYRNPSGMMGRSSANGYGGGFPPPPHRR